MQKYHIGDVVILNDKPLQANDWHEDLVPGATGMVICGHHCATGAWRDNIRWYSPNEMLRDGWWVHEDNLDPVSHVDPIDIETLL